MGHMNAGIFQAYINERISCDVQAAFLGRPSATALLKSMSHMSRDIDPRAPNDMSDADKDALKIHPLIVEFRERRDTLSKEVKREFGTLKKAKAAGSITYKLYQEANSDFGNLKQKLRRTKRNESRKEFFETIETEDARRQLRRVALGLKKEEWQPVKAEHILVERTRVIELLFEPSPRTTPEEKLEHRIQTIDALVFLCRQKEIRPMRKTRREYDWGILPIPDPTPEPTPEPTPKSSPETCSQAMVAPIAVTNKQCIFCICKTGQTNDFCRPRKAREHVERQHLRFFHQDDVIPCPDLYCRMSGVLLFGHKHFKSHVEKVHRCSLLPYSIW
jgi:hypothetical protein